MPIALATRLSYMLVMASLSGQVGGTRAARVVDNVTENSSASRAFRLDEIQYLTCLRGKFEVLQSAPMALPSVPAPALHPPRPPAHNAASVFGVGDGVYASIVSFFGRFFHVEADYAHDADNNFTTFRYPWPSFDPGEPPGTQLTHSILSSRARTASPSWFDFTTGCNLYDLWRFACNLLWRLRETLYARVICGDSLDLLRSGTRTPSAMRMHSPALHDGKPTVSPSNP